MHPSENIRVRLEPGLKGRWEGCLTEHQITQQAAVTSVVEWLLEQDPLTRSMIFRQVPKTDRVELSRIVLRRLAAAGGKPKAKG